MKHSDYFKEVVNYCKDITTGRILAGEYTKKAIKRFNNDLKKINDEGFPFQFDENQFIQVVSFAESLILPDTKKPLKLLGWQLFIYANLFGWVYKDNPERRRFRTAYNEVARKNGKTSAFLYPLILYDFITSTSAESYLVSKDEKQAEKSFKETIEVIKENKELNQLKEQGALNCYSNAITLQTSRIAFFSSESSAIDGYRNSLSVIDEYWCYNDDKIVSAFRYGGRARLNNLNIIITSAGLDVSSACYAENKKAKAILDGTLVDDSYFAIIYSYDETDDWKDPKNFIKANPSLGTFLKEDVLLSDLSDALITPSHQPDFKSKTCGIWTNDVSSWIPIEKWNSAIKEFNLNDLEKVSCFGALDLSSINDLTAYTLCWSNKGNYYYKHHFYIPEATLFDRYQNENINFIEWVNKGIITLIKGTTIDYDFIYKDILEDYKRFNIKEIAYDRWSANDLINKLNDELPNINYIEFDQRLQNMALPTKEYEKLILEGKVFDPNPAMLWQISNVKIKPDPNGNYKPLKDYKASNQRIDGVISSIMATSRAKANSTTIPEVSFSHILNSF